MHEQALVLDLRRRLSEIARADPGLRIRRVRLWVGALSHLTEPSVREMWPSIAEGVCPKDAQLEVEVSTDLADPRAQGVVLTSVDVEGGGT